MVFDRGAYWLPLRGLLGLEGRWGGASGFPNISGQAGALLVVYGVVRPIGRRWAFMLSGIVIMLLTDSRTSYAAGAVGLCLLASLPGWGATYWKVTPARVIALALGIGMAIRVVLKVLMDPNLTGRMAMWPEFLALARRFLPFGGGQQVIDSAISSGQLPAWAHQGHNLFLDTLVRHGAVGLLLTVAFIGIAFILTARPVRRELAAGLALLAALVTSCMGDLGIDWTYPSEGLSVLLVAVLVSQVEPRVPERPSDGAVTASSPSPLG
jgi:O-antigen ligase